MSLRDAALTAQLVRQRAVWAQEAVYELQALVRFDSAAVIRRATDSQRLEPLVLWLVERAEGGEITPNVACEMRIFNTVITATDAFTRALDTTILPPRQPDGSQEESLESGTSGMETVLFHQPSQTRPRSPVKKSRQQR